MARCRLSTTSCRATWGRRASIDSLHGQMSSSEVELRDLVLHGRSGSDDIIEGLGDLGVGIDQRSLVRYSRLLARDAKQWLDKPETTHLAFSPVKQMGFVKLVAVVTMYAETPALLDRTLRGLAQCVQQLSTDIGFLRSWEEAVVCIVQSAHLRHRLRSQIAKPSGHGHRIFEMFS